MKTAVSGRLRVSPRVVWVLSLMLTALLPQSVNGQSSSATTTTVVPSADTITLGDTVTLTAIVSTSGGDTPTGQVTFFDGNTPIGTGPVLTLDVNSAASFTTSLLSANASPHSITAVYHGDLIFSPSTSSAISVTVQPRTSTTGEVLNPTTVVVGQPSTATVTLTDSGSVPPGIADTFAATGAPATGRTAFAATLFADGLVLVAGGMNSTGTVLNSAEIYNVSGAGFTATGNLNTGRTGAVAVLLPNGKVLIAGGSSDGTANGALNTAELFDPNTGTFALTTNNMNAARFGAPATLLNNGKVLLAGGENSGGVLNTAELYDPAADTFAAAGNLSTARTGAAATLLGTGKVLVAGGSSDGTANGALNSAELFDPDGNCGAGTFTAVTGANSTLTTGRWQVEAALLLSGKVLIAGGQNSGGALSSADLYDPVANTFSPSNHSMAQARANGSAVALPNGMVLLAGGTTSQAVNLYDADSDLFDATGSLQQSDDGLVSILLNNGQVLVVGLTTGSIPASDAELYSPSFNPLGTVAVTSSEAADNIPGSCVLIPSSNTASNCTSTITPSNPPTSPHTITGTYSADAIHSGSSNTASLTVNKTDTVTAVTSSANPAVLGQSVTFTATVSAVAPGGGTPTGTVVFLDGGAPIGFGTMSGGVATFTTSALGLGNHPIMTNYGGDSNFNGSTGTLTGTPQVVNKISSTTVLTSSANPAVVGQSVTFTATISAVAPGSGTPSGTVVFLDGGAPIGFGTMSGGVATFTTSALGLGNHPIMTNYGGDSNFNGSTGTLTGTPQVVNKANSATTVTSSLNPSIVGQSVTFTATVSAVAPGSGTPSGSVTFFDGGISIGTGTLSSGVATLSTSALALGNHTITTTYGGDGTFNGSTGSLTGNPQVVNKPSTTTSVTSSVNPSVFGQSVTFTATVSVVAPGVGTATGTVTFFDGGTSIGTGTLSGGVATLATSVLAVGNHTITTNYPGDANFSGSAGSLTGNPQVVNKANSTMTVTSSLNPSVSGQAITFTATVSAVAPGAGTATGTVTFLSGGSPIGSGILSGGVATLTTSTVAVGIHTITASYGGDANFNSSTGSLAGNPQIVSKSDSVTAVTSSANPAVLGQSVTFTATVSAVAPGGGTPTGTVVFLDGGAPIGFGTLSGGVATFTTSALGLGNHPIMTSYGGDSNFNGSTGTLMGAPQVVNKANSATTVTSSLNPSIVGQSVTFTATVSAVAPGSGTPSGSVTFFDGGISIGTGTLSSGVATLSSSVLTLGSHTITTTYGGDGTFNSSTGSLTGNPQVVNKPSTTTSVTSSVNPSVFGQSVTFTATVSVVAPGVGTATGTVTFFDGGTSIGTGTLSGGVATLATSTLAVGNHTITTNYPGDANFSGSAGSLTGNPQAVNKANSTMTVTSSLNPSVSGQAITFTATVSAVAPGAGTATGTVTFLSGGSSIGSGILSGGVATLTTSTVAVGIHTITASYGGDANFNSSTGSLAGNPQIVSKSDSVTAVTSSANPAVLGQSVTFTATISAVAPGSGTPTGTVTFLDGGAPIGAGMLSGGVATFTTSALVIGSHSITTSYPGDSNFNGNTGTLTGTPQVVNKASTATAVSSSANPAVLGQSVTFTATVSAVAPGSGTPSGSVTFFDGGISIGTGTLSSGVATLSTSALTLGNHTITTSYGGDSSFNGSTGSLTGNPQVVGKPSSTTTVASSRNPSALGQSVTFTATVSATPPGSGTPTGTVTFLDGGASIGTGTLSGGVATLTASSLTAGNHTITASYGGDANFNGGAGPLTGNPQIVVAPPGVAKAFTPTTILPNGNSVLTITLTNPSANTVALTGVAITDTFPANLIVATPNAIANTCGGTTVAAAGSTGAALTGGSIPVNGSCAVSVNVTSAASGSYVNTTGTVGSTNGGTGATASSTLSVASPPTISEVFGATAIALSGSTSLTFTLANPATNSIPLTGVAFTDSLPSGLQVASPNGLSGTCGGGTITAAAGSSSVALSSATLPVSGSCTIAVNVTGTVLGAQNNSVTVTSSNGGSGNTSSASLNVVPPDFSVSMTATSESVKAGQPAAFTFTIGPANGVAVPTTVTLSISGLPPNSTASFQPASVTPGSTSITDTLVITTTPSVPYLTQDFRRDFSDSESASLHWRASDAPFLGPGGSSFNPLRSVLTCLLILGLSGSGFGRRKWLRVRTTGLCLLLLLCVACGGIGLTGCASAQKLQTLGTPAGTYSVTVTATLATPSGNVQHSTTITLTVLP